MKYRLLIIVFIFFPALLGAQPKFNKNFEDASLRINYLLAGTASSAEVFLEQMKAEPNYGGSKVNLIDEQNYGTYRYRVLDLESGDLLFSKGFCPLFQEWQTTAEAEELKRSFYQVAIIPFPKAEITFCIDYLDRNGVYNELFSVEVDPDDYFILKEDSPDFEVDEIMINGKPDEKVDLVFLAEGYTESQMDEFIDDVNRMVDALFETSPFDEHNKDFNIYAVKLPSEQTGTDNPGEGIYKNTALNSSFYTFDIPRYLTVTDMKEVHDAASLVPYDQIVVLVNTNEYGGGGFYNFVSVVVADNSMSEKVFIHEFGHAFAGLADEYYTSEVAYQDYYNLEIEPWEPNLTTLVDFESKWKNLLDESTPVPTPRTREYSNTVGVFEGGGYVEKGIYSPMMNCIMKSIQADGFCPACQQAIEDAILLNCK